VAENVERLSEFFAPFESIPFDDAAGEQYAVIRLQLEKEGRLIGANDMLIAAIAMAHDLVLVTRNNREFHRIAGLRIQKWE